MGRPLVIAAVALAMAACGGGDAARPATTSAPARGAAAHGVRLVRIGTFDQPLYVTAPAGDRRRVFVVEQAGRIMVVRGGRKLAQPFLDIRSQVLSGGEQGLLSMAFAPDYARSGRFYVYFTGRDSRQHVVEYRRASADRALRGSARVILRMNDPESNHNGGLLLFG